MRKRTKPDLMRELLKPSLNWLFIGPQPLMLSFNRAETGVLFIGVLLATIVCGDGCSNWYKEFSWSQSTSSSR